MNRQRSASKSVLSFCLAVMLALQTIMFTGATYAENADGETGSPNAEDPTVIDTVYDEPHGAFLMSLMSAEVDKTDVFMDANTTFPLVVKQGNPPAVIEPGGTIQGRQQFTLTSENLVLPVIGDDEDPANADPGLYIQQGDWIELKREIYFQEVILPTATKDLMANTSTGQAKLGTAYFTPESIKIVFDGDENFFNGIRREVRFGFDTTADSDLTGINYGATKPITIFGEAYFLKNPDITPAYSIDISADNFPKNGSWTWWYPNIQAYKDGYLTFHSNLSAFDSLDPTIQLPLDGMTFYTKPSDYDMVYKPGSFKVNGIAVEPDVDAEGSLRYTFPPDTGENPKVEFQAWFHKVMFYKEHRGLGIDPGRNNGYRFDPRVELRDASDAVQVFAQREGWIGADWIQASASYDHPTETITWTVVVNGRYEKKGLKNLTITNELPEGLIFLSATWKTWIDGTEYDKGSITPDANNVYSFGDIDGKVELVIKTKVAEGSSFRIDPRANWDLDTPGGIQNNDVTAGLRPNAVTDEAEVIIGAHTFTKTGGISIEDYNLGAITWTVSLTPQYALPDAAIYDLLVHGGNLNVLDNAVDETGEVNAATIAKIKANVTTAQLWKQYHEGTLAGVTNADGLTLKHIPLTVDGEVVADLIKVTGFTTDQPISFRFRSLETNPDILFRQDPGQNKGRGNRALLIDGESVKVASDTVNLHLRMLNKDMLTASYPIKADGTADTWFTPNNVHRYIGYDGSSSGDEYTVAAFDHTTKTVTFRLGVNMPGYNTDVMAMQGGNRVITDVKLVDTLPEGWEFVPFSEEKDFELWKGSSHNGSGANYGARNTAVEIIEPGDPAHVVEFTHSGNVGTFTFTKLESPYVILVKARPSNEALEQYLEELTTNGTDRQVLYNKADLHMTWGGVEKVVTEQRKVIVPVQVLGKSVTKPFPGVLEWKVDYYPPYHMEDGVYLQDTIGAGMNLRYDGSGNLILTAPSMAVYRARLTASGALEPVGEALDLSDPDSEVQVEAEPGDGGTTVLKFMLQNPNDFYQFVYQTEVDPDQAKAGDTMGNKVELIGDDNLESVSASSESTLDHSDVAGSAGDNALLPLIKVAPDCTTPLEGVEFSLYKVGEDEPTRQGKTGADGKLSLIFPDPGFYELKETEINTEKWLPTTKIFQVYVGNSPGKPVWVDGIQTSPSDPFVVCTPDAGHLLITNQLEGNGKDTDKEFTYTVTFSGEGEGGDKSYSYTYTKQDGGTETGTINSGGMIRLKHDESVLFHPIATGTTYTVTQDDYSHVGYSTNPAGLVHTGSIPSSIDPDDNTVKAPFVNTRNVGSLLIGNTVVGDEADKDFVFEYTIDFDGIGEGGSKDYTVTKSDSSTVTIKSGGTITLKHGETAVITDIVTGTSYSVIQKDYTDAGFTTDPASFIRFGEIETGVEKKAEFVNSATGSLLIGNTVTGNGGEPGKEFAYTITFSGSGANESYVYDKSDGTSGTIESGDTITLKHGQTITIMDLPAGLDYKIVQADYSADEYSTNPENLEHTGSIERAVTSEARFVNHKDLPGGLLIGNTVTGNGADPDKIFEYTVTFTGPGAGKIYAYTNSDGPDGTIQSGDTLELKHGQTVTITGITKDTAYKVVQSDYAADGYTTEPADRTFEGSIKEAEIAEARYVNARYLPGTLDLEADPRKVPGDGKTPSKLTATLTGTDGKPVKDAEIVFELQDGTEIGRSTTDQDGKATIVFIPPKLYETTPKDYKIVATTTATSPSGVPYNEAEDTVTAMPAALTGVLRDNNTGEIIPHAEIVIENVRTSEKITITTDEEGRYYHPVQRDEEYTITYTRLIKIGGKLEPIPFTQKAIIEDTDTTTEGNLIPAEITAVGIVLNRKPDGETAQFSPAWTSKMHIYLKDENGEYVKDANDEPKAFDMQAGGTFAVEGLTEQTYTMEVRYEVEPGKELLVTVKKLDVKADGELNISEELVDPYGTVYDETTGDAATGKKIVNAEVRLYFANTPRNIAKGNIPDTQVDLPPVPDFPPENNKSMPYQASDANGFYAFMVFPEADYYLVVKKSGYQTYTSPTISVEFDIVRHDVPMKPIVSGDEPGQGDAKKDKVPKTGDSSLPPNIYIALALISMAMLGWLLLGSRKKRI